MHKCSVLPVGLEQPQYLPRKPGITGQSAAESGAVLAQKAVPAGSNYPELAAVVEAWPGLPEAMRRQIMGMVQGAMRDQPAT